MRSKEIRLNQLGVRKAVIPAAGLGSRMLPLTSNLPKEMLTVAGKPLLQHTIEEAIASGLEEICVVISDGKECIREYFSPRSNCGSGVTAAPLASLLKNCELTFVYQAEPKGVGDALLRAKSFVKDSSFVMMIPDQQFHGGLPATKQLLRYWRPGPLVWSSLVRIPREELRFFPGARGVRFSHLQPDLVMIEDFESDDELRQTFRDCAYEIRGFGRTIYPPEIFAYLGPAFRNYQTGEMDLLKTHDSFRRAITNYAVILQGKPFDFGTLDGYYHYANKQWE